jgi:hypothetical protein
MSATQIKRRPSTKLLLAYVYTLGLFGLTAFYGMGGPGDFADSATALQKICSVVVTAYGILGVLSAVGLIAKHRWVLRVTTAWGAVITMAAVLAPLAWAPGETTWWNTALGAALALALGWTVYRVVRWIIQPERETDV